MKIFPFVYHYTYSLHTTINIEILYKSGNTNFNTAKPRTGPCRPHADAQTSTNRHPKKSLQENVQVGEKQKYFILDKINYYILLKYSRTFSRLSIAEMSLCCIAALHLFSINMQQRNVLQPNNVARLSMAHLYTSNCTI